MNRNLLLALGWLAASAVLQARTFTSTDGRKIEGTLLDATDSDATIKRDADGRSVKVPLAMLIPEHRKEIDAWRQQKAVGRLTVTATKDKEVSKMQSGGGRNTVVDSKDQQWCWVITVKNNSATPMRGLELEWAQLVERKDRNAASSSGPSKSAARRSNGRVPVPDIPAFGSVKVRTSPIAVQAYRSTSASTSTSSSGEKYTTLTTYKWDEALTGLGVVVHLDAKAVLRWRTGTDPGVDP